MTTLDLPYPTGAPTGTPARAPRGDDAPFLALGFVFGDPPHRPACGATYCRDGLTPEDCDRAQGHRGPCGPAEILRETTLPEGWTSETIGQRWDMESGWLRDTRGVVRVCWTMKWASWDTWATMRLVNVGRHAVSCALHHTVTEPIPWPALTKEERLDAARELVAELGRIDNGVILPSSRQERSAVMEELARLALFAMAARP